MLSASNVSCRSERLLSAGVRPRRTCHEAPGRVQPRRGRHHGLSCRVGSHNPGCGHWTARRGSRQRLLPCLASSRRRRRHTVGTGPPDMKRSRELQPSLPPAMISAHEHAGRLSLLAQAPDGDISAGPIGEDLRHAFQGVNVSVCPDVPVHAGIITLRCGAIDTIAQLYYSFLSSPLAASQAMMPQANPPARKGQPGSAR